MKERISNTRLWAWPLLIVAATGGACSSSGTSDEETVNAQWGSDYIPPVPEFTVNSAVCTVDVRTRACPPVPGFTPRKLFPNGPGQLGVFCLYEATGSEANFESLLETTGLDSTIDCGYDDWCHPDRGYCDVPQTYCDGSLCEHDAAAADVPLVAPLGRITDGPVPRQAYYDTYHRAVGAVEGSEIGKINACRGPHSVRVAVIDTDTFATRPANADEEWTDPSAHGRGVARVIHDLACPNGGPCVADVRSHPALVRDPTHGKQSDLASAIYKAVQNWYATTWTPNQNEQTRLVINLSLGWDRWKDNGEVSAPRRIPEAAVWGALAYASCHGALIVAAAGNRSGTRNTPTYPAAWAEYPEPTDADCRQMFGFSRRTPQRMLNDSCEREQTGANAHRPMLYAIAAVDAKDQLLPARQRSLSPLVSFGHGVLANHSFHAQDVESILTHPLSGSSMAAATASGIAASVWAFDRTMGPHQVMHILYESAEPLPALGTPFATLQDGLRPQVRRASQCRALARVTHDETLDCSSHVAAGKGKSLAINPAWYGQWWLLAKKQNVHGGATNTWPGLDTVPFSGPQPFDSGCPSCGFTPSGDLLAALTPPYFDSGEDYLFDSLVVTVVYDDGTSKPVDITGQASVKRFRVEASYFKNGSRKIKSAFMTYSGFKGMRISLVEPLAVP